MKVSLRDIEIGDLNNVCIMLISKFARALHAHDGSVIKLRQPDVLIEVARHAKTTNSSELKILYERLKMELRMQLNDSIPNHAEVGDLVIHDDLVKQRIRRRAEARQLSQGQ